MRIRTARRHAGEWELVGHCGERLCLGASDQGPFEIDVLGTKLPKARKKTDRFAGALADLERPIILLDVRRNGCGAQASSSNAQPIPERLKQIVEQSTRGMMDAIHHSDWSVFGTSHFSLCGVDYSPKGAEE